MMSLKSIPPDLEMIELEMIFGRVQGTKMQLQWNYTRVLRFFAIKFKVLQKPLNKTSLEAKIISPDLSRVAVLVLRHQVWSNDSGDGGFVGGVQNVGEDGAKIIDFTAADHTESLALKNCGARWRDKKPWDSEWMWCHGHVAG